MIMRKLAIVLIILIIQFFTLAHAAIVTQAQPFMRNGLKINLVTYQDPAIALVKKYPDLLLVHGMTYSSRQFDLNLRDYSLARQLVKQGYRVWLLDITGYGESQKPKDGRIVNSDYAAQDIQAATDYILKKNHVDKINILGWSWGTITSSLFTAKHPDKVNKLVLVAPILHSLNFPSPKEMYHPFSLKDASGDFQQDRGITDPDVFKAYLAQTKKYDGAGSPTGARIDLFHPKDVTLLPYQQLRIPVLIIGGDNDPYISTQKDFDLMMKYATKESCARIFPGAGHILFLEKPYYLTFQHDVVSFLKNGCSSVQNNSLF